ncbi:MAG TPA: hypothetical protein VG206_18280 [Terriglobia bacterium]|nr:hypothetical protein [Terriglobia bacterium]
MTRFRSFASLLLGAALICACGALVRAQQLQTPAAEWTPLVARFVERDQTWTEHGLPETLEFSGSYLRDRRGSWYRRMQVASHLNLLAIVGGTDSGLLYDRPNHTMYSIDFTRGTVQKQVVDASVLPDFAAAPMSRKVFEAFHSEDRYLGKKRLGSLECEGYALRDERRRNKYVAEMWYAPSLAFLAVAAKSHFKGDQDVTTLLEDIQPGKDPDPQFFTVPVNLKAIK